MVSRDAKEFSFEIPHMIVDEYIDMNTLLYGRDVEDAGVVEHTDGIVDKLEAYVEKFGDTPENVVIDSVSQITMDVINKASLTPNVYGSQGAEITKEMGILTNFIHEELELNGINVVLLNHIIPEKIDGKETGEYLQFGQGKFLSKGGFYSTSNEAITIVPVGSNRKVYIRDNDKKARTLISSFPDTAWVENVVDKKKSKKLKDGESYFTLKGHLETLKKSQKNVEKWSL